MLTNERLFEPFGYAVGIFTLIISTIFFYYYSADFYYSFIGAILAAMMVWLSYVIMRLLYLASR